MYTRVCFGDPLHGESSDTSVQIPTEVLINPDCPVRILIAFLREVFKVEENCELDLCDRSGNLVFLNEKEPSAAGSQFLKSKATYYVVLVYKDSNGYRLKPVLHRSDSITEEESPWSDIMVKIKKQLKVTQKSSRNLKMRSTAHIK